MPAANFSTRQPQESGLNVCGGKACLVAGSSIGFRGLAHTRNGSSRAFSVTPSPSSHRFVAESRLRSYSTAQQHQHPAVKTSLRAGMAAAARGGPQGVLRALEEACDGSCRSCCVLEPRIRPAGEIRALARAKRLCGRLDIDVKLFLDSFCSEPCDG